MTYFFSGVFLVRKIEQKNAFFEPEKRHQKVTKKYANNFWRIFLVFKASMSETGIFDFFENLIIAFSKTDILKMSKNKK